MEIKLSTLCSGDPAKDISKAISSKFKSIVRVKDLPTTGILEICQSGKER